MATTKKKNVGIGASPRVYPRPSYPSLLHVLKSMFNDVVWQAGIQGSIIALLVHPFYLWTREMAKLYELSDAMYFAIMISAVHTVMYLAVNCVFMLYDYYGLYQEYKLDRKEYMKPDGKLLRKLAVQATISQVVTGPLLAYYLFPIFGYFGMMDFDAALPSFLECAKTFMIGHVFNDIGFYWTHRLMHAKIFYKTFHKQHHEFRGTIGFAAEYAGPVEIVVSNQIPTLGGVLFFGCHPLCVWIWLALRLQQTYEAHSGYCFDGHILDKLGLAHADGAAHHDHHHTSNQGNFGNLYTDYFFGTMDHYMSIGGLQGYIDLKMHKEK